MSNEIILNKEEAVKLAVKYYRQPVYIEYANNNIEGEHTFIGRDVLQSIEYKTIISFQIKLRGIHEMTDDEVLNLTHLGFEDKRTFTEWLTDNPFNYFPAKDIDYLRSIGIDTDGIKDKTILIK